MFFTLAVAIFTSLWPAIALHVLVDLDAGIVAWLALREPELLPVESEHQTVEA